VDQCSYWPSALSLEHRASDKTRLLTNSMVLRSASLASRPLSLPLRSPLLTHCSLRPPRTEFNVLPRLSVRPVSRRRPINPRRPPQYNRFENAQHAYNFWRVSRTFRVSTGVIIVGCGIFYYVNLERVPVSGRLRFNFVSQRYLQERIGKQEAQSIAQEYGPVLPPSHPDSEMVNRVLRRLIPASGLEHLNWEVRVIDDPDQVYAFVMPGGKVFVFSGILPICRDEDGLAAVLGHEISHELATHTGEKLSRNFWVFPLMVLTALSFDISLQFSAYIFDLVLKLPPSRKMEVR